MADPKNGTTARPRPAEARPPAAAPRAQNQAGQPVSSRPAPGAQTAPRPAASAARPAPTPGLNTIGATTMPGATDVTELRKQQSEARKQAVERGKSKAVSKKDAIEAADSVAPSIGTAAPNPAPRAAITSTARANLNEPPSAVPASAAPERIKVQATQLGYYDDARRRAGDVFYIRSHEDFSERWMRVVADDTPVRTTSMTEAMRIQHDEIRAMAANEPASGRTVDRLKDFAAGRLGAEPGAGEEAPVEEAEPGTGEEDVLGAER